MTGTTRPDESVSNSLNLNKLVVCLNLTEPKAARLQVDGEEE
jgi:hypothetical protein